MAQYKVPEDLCETIASRAVLYSQEAIRRRGWSKNSALSLVPVWREGVVGVDTPRKHLIYQERGFRPFLMKSLEGRRVPIDGRVLTVSGVGQPGFVTIPRPGGGPPITKWRNQKWRHPGLKPKGFLKNSISRAVLEEKPRVRREILRRLAGQ